jgi:CheY-like chemotaxis protein
MMRKTKRAPTARLRVGALGDFAHHEFVDARVWLSAHADVRSITGNVDAAALDLVVLACARRGEFSLQMIRRLRAAAPLARIVAITGSWCAGPWRRPVDLVAGVTVVPWHRWCAWAEVNRAQLVQGRAASWSLPETTSADELAEFWSGQPVGDDRGLILMDASSAESAELLAEVVRCGGYSAVSSLPSDYVKSADIRAIVCEADDARRQTLVRIAQLSRQFPRTPIVAVVNFPQADDKSQIIAAGGAAVVGKPFTLHEILAQLGDALRREGISRSTAA